MKLGSFFKQSIALALCAWILSLSAYAQSEGGRVGFGVSGGGVKYWGTFTDNQLWFAGDMFVRWNIIDQISLQASVGFGQMRYKNTDKAKMENPNFYGLFPTDKQPQEKNFSRFNYYETYLSWNILPREKFVPYIFGGLGVLDWNPTYQDGSALPLNDGTSYEKRKMVIPVGLGYELYLTDDLVFNGRGTLRLTGTGWIDGYDARTTINGKSDNSSDADDLLLTFGAGFSYYVFGNADYDNDGLTNSTERELAPTPKIPILMAMDSLAVMKCAVIIQTRKNPIPTVIILPIMQKYLIIKLHRNHPIPMAMVYLTAKKLLAKQIRNNPTQIWMVYLTAMKSANIKQIRQKPIPMATA
ncbi:MAG: outer membrane beta-barrel protein [Ignavibacteria bacterium]|nr:outer membrane beta-barrel protein [Ignavibacteria bacterium]